MNGFGHYFAANLQQLLESLLRLTSTELATLTELKNTMCRKQSSKHFQSLTLPVKQPETM